MQLNYFSYLFTNNSSYIIIFLFITFFAIYIVYIVKYKSIKSNNLQNQVIKIVNITIIFPLIISLIYAIFFFRNSFSSIFNNNISKVLYDSSLVAEAYYEEYKEKTLHDALTISQSINDNTAEVMSDQKILKALIESYVNLKELSEGIIFIPSKNLIIAKNEFSFALSFDSIPNEAIETAGIDHPILIENLNSNKIRAIIELNNFPYKTYLLIGRYMDDKVIKYIADTKNAMSSYNVLTNKIHSLQNIFLMIFVVILALLIFTSKYVARLLTSQLVKPIDSFVFITQKIAKGDFSLKLEQKTNINELDILTDSFNQMIDELNKSKKELAARSNFIETILSQIPTGLIVIKNNDNVIMKNHAADTLLYNDIKKDFLQNIKSIIEENKNNKYQNEHSISLDNHCFLTRITYFEIDEVENKHFLITFTDITEHLSYQKNLLWIEVAKRITHEIRNPLTPIILSADRLEDKYLKNIPIAESENFLKYLNNIKRHTNDIAHIIDEFVKFGKMPDPIFAIHDLNIIIEKAISGSNFDKNIEYKYSGKQIFTLCDDKQILRALLNVFKNSYEAMINNINKTITIKLEESDDDWAILTIQDMGPGFSDKLINKITEPYVSTKSKGSGLGLSIVKKIIDEHHGKLIISNDENHHAVVVIKFKI